MATLRGMAAALSTLALFIAAPALALSVSTDVGASVGVGGTGVSVDGGANATSGSTTAPANAGADLSIPLVVTRGDVSAGTLQHAPIDASNVETKTDLSVFIQGQMNANAALTSVDAASDHVAVTYEEPGLFLGILPVSVETTATTDASGNVTVTEPWWDFLAASDQSNLQANVNSSVDAVLGANASANSELSMSQQARLVSAIESALAAGADASASANASAAASAQ